MATKKDKAKKGKAPVMRSHDVTRLQGRLNCFSYTLLQCTPRREQSCPSRASSDGGGGSAVQHAPYSWEAELQPGNTSSRPGRSTYTGTRVLRPPTALCNAQLAAGQVGGGGGGGGSLPHLNPVLPHAPVISRSFFKTAVAFSAAAGSCRGARTATGRATAARRRSARRRPAVAGATRPAQAQDADCTIVLATRARRRGDALRMQPTAGVEDATAGADRVRGRRVNHQAGARDARCSKGSWPQHNTQQAGWAPQAPQTSHSHRSLIVPTLARISANKTQA